MLHSGLGTVGRVIDYRDEVSLEARPWLRRVYWLAGSVSLVVGIIGIFLPVLPTVPFLLLASICYARASVRLYNWLMNHRWFGPPLRDWKRTKSLPVKVKVFAISMIALSGGYSVVFLIPLLAMKVFVSVCCTAVAFYLALGIPTRG